MFSTSAFSSLRRPLRSILLAIRPRVLLVSAALMLAVASLSGKMTYYSRTATGETEISEEQRVTNFLIRHGWTAIGVIEPDRWSPLRFIGPMCPAGIQVTMVSPSGEMAAFSVRVAGEDHRVFYVHRGKVSDVPPRFAYIEDRIGDLLKALGIVWSRSTVVFRVIEPVQCRLRSTLSWSDL